MADRKVNVRVGLEVSEYMNNGRRLRTETALMDKALDELGDEADRAGDELDRLAKNSDSVRRSSNLTTPSVDHLGRSISKSGDQSKSAAAGYALLRKRIEEAKVAMEALALQFAQSGDVQVSKELNSKRAEIRRMEQAAKILLAAATGAAVAGGGGSGGGGAASSFTAVLGALPSQLKGAAIVGLVAGAVAASPLIGSILSGAVIGTGGLVGLGGGVALAFQDPRVKAAAGDLGMRVKIAFTDAADGMVAPTVGALGILGDAGRDVAAQMGEAWAGLAPEVEPFADAISGLVREMMPGFLDLLEEARPFLRMLAKELPEIGDALSDFFSTISNEGDGAILGFNALLDLLQGTLRVTGDVLNSLSQIFEWYVRQLNEGSAVLLKAFDWLPWVGDMLQQINNSTGAWLSTLDGANEPSEEAARATRELGAAVDIAAEAAKAATPRFERLFDVWMSADQAADAVEASLDSLTESISENGATLDIHTEQGRANRQALREGVEAAKAYRDAMIAQQGPSAALDEAYRRQIAALRQTAKDGGLAASQIEAIIGPYERLIALPNTTKKVTVMFVSDTSGYSPPRVPGGTHVAMRHGGVVYAQHGLIANGGSMTSPTVIAGERGTKREWYIPEAGISRDRGLALAGSAAAAYHGRVVPYEQMRGGGTSTVVHEYRLIVEGTGVLQGLKREIRFRGGDVQEALGS